MALNANKIPNNNQGKDKIKQPVLPIGTYPARLVQIIDMGLQPQRPYQGTEKPPAHEVMLTYEFVDEFMVDENGDDIEEKPRWQSETIPFYSLKTERAKSTLRYKAFDPEGKYDGDFSQTIGCPVNVTITHGPNAKDPESPYINIGGVTAMRKRDADKCPELVNPSKVFDLDDPDMEVFNSLPEWVRDKIKGNLNFLGSPLEAALGAGNKKEQKKAKKEEPDGDNPDIDDHDVPY